MPVYNIKKCIFSKNNTISFGDFVRKKGDDFRNPIFKKYNSKKSLIEAFCY